MRKITANEFKLSSIIIGILATLMILFPALAVGDSNTSYSGIQIAFGHEFINLGGFGSGQIEFSILNLIAYALPLIAALLLIFTKQGNLASTIIFGAAAVMFFLVPEFTVVSTTILGNVNEINIDWTYDIGLIFAASLSLIGLLIGLFRIYKKV
ncbi:MAG: hypothetical protein NUK62_00825 [Tenericutes bacterium]|nr:hypothetical protein [Mycoplasmatota bacterium]